MLADIVMKRPALGLPDAAASHRAGSALLRRLFPPRVLFERRRAHGEASALDDRMLRDIGLSRIEAERRIIPPFWVV